MQSLLIAVGFLVLIAIWSVFENGRKFRREFQARGKSWSSVCTALACGQGILVVDTIWGPQRGLGHPVVWWFPAAPAPRSDLAELFEDRAGHARLVRCPRHLRSQQALRSRFGESRVILHSWAIEEQPLPTGQERI